MSGLPWMILILCIASGGIGWAVIEFGRWFFLSHSMDGNMNTPPTQPANVSPEHETAAAVERVRRRNSGEDLAAVYECDFAEAMMRWNGDCRLVAELHIARLDEDAEREKSVPRTVDGVEILCGSIVHIDNNDTAYFGQSETLECKVTGFTTEKLFEDYKGRFVIMADCGDEAIEFGCEDCYADVANLLSALKGEA